MPLLWALRENLGLTGTKFGCGISACGACTVHLDGRAVRSCTLPISAADGKQVTTIEGLAPNDSLHKVQQAWIAHQVPQCGYCQSGMIMAVGGTARADSEADRRGDRRGDHQRLPLRHVRARSRGHPRSGRWKRGGVMKTPPVDAANNGKKTRNESGLKRWSRRAFIGAGTVAGGGFLLGVAGFTFAPSRYGLVSADAAERGQLTTWITISPDNSITILIPHCEMGQGTQTALAMMAAEELEADWSLVRVQEAPALDAYANGYIVRAAGGNYVPAVMGRGVDYGALQDRVVVRLPGHRRLDRRAQHRRVRHAGRRRRRTGRCSWPPPRSNGVCSASECKAKGSRSAMPPLGGSDTFGALAHAAATQRCRPVPRSRRRTASPSAARRPCGWTFRRRWTAARSTRLISARRGCFTRRSKWHPSTAASSCRLTRRRRRRCPA